MDKIQSKALISYEKGATKAVTIHNLFDSLGLSARWEQWGNSNADSKWDTDTRAGWLCIETLYAEYTPLHTFRGKRGASLKIKVSLQSREWVQKNPDPGDVSKLSRATQTIAFIYSDHSAPLNNVTFCREIDLGPVQFVV